MLSGKALIWPQRSLRPLLGEQSRDAPAGARVRMNASATIPDPRTTRFVSLIKMRSFAEQPQIEPGANAVALAGGRRASKQFDQLTVATPPKQAPAPWDG